MTRRPFHSQAAESGLGEYQAPPLPGVTQQGPSYPRAVEPERCPPWYTGPSPKGGTAVPAPTACESTHRVIQGKRQPLVSQAEDVTKITVRCLR
ncbi:hypothetical protein NDU88_000612 [Pleurodeles waltl]|uniref:Uncharacterized protein n=1 Tax=Pleurodeles waltl TaxID=8319 RepID=A0AAV7V5V9_PLEWA|nr:hypothetical protein NDU88_000612 [Pleurodeles waltl]